MKKKTSIILLIPLTFLLGNCGSTSPDIKAAQNLAKLQGDARTVFLSISEDVYISCLRTADFTLLNSPGSGEIDRDIREAKKVCEGNPKEASAALAAANQVILDYLEALGQLAADDLTNFDKELNNIGSSLQTLPGLNTGENKEAVEAGTAIAKFLFRAFTDAYRRQELRQAVITVDPSLQTLVTALSKAVGQHYVGLLNTEQVAVDNYYGFYLGRVLTAPLTESVSAQVDTETTNRERWNNTNKTIQERKKLANSYVILIRKIANDHSSLKKMYVKGEEPSPVQVKQMIDEYSKELKSLVEKSEKLFPKK